MMAVTPLLRLSVILLSAALLLNVSVDATSPGWCKFSTAIKHTDKASRSWRTSSDDVHLIASRKNRAAAETPEQREPTLVEKCIIGGVVIGGTTAMEYASGFLGGFVLGTVVGIPGLAYSKEGLKMGQRFSNMNARSMRWAKTWAPISAVFGGCDAATRIVRGNKKDQWNTIISSAAAGAYFSRAGMVIPCYDCHCVMFVS